MEQKAQQTMQIKTRIKAGLVGANHSETLVGE
jgi:hypothetical protein